MLFIFITLVDYMRPQIVKILAIALFLLNSASMLSQRSGSGKGPPTPTNQRTTPPELPLDDSILILIVIGLIYGAFIAYKRYRIKNSPA